MTTRLLIRTKPRENLPPIDGKYPRIQALTTLEDIEFFTVNAETGEQTPLTNVASAMIRIDPQEAIQAQLVFFDVDLDVEAVQDESEDSDLRRQLGRLTNYARNLAYENAELREKPALVIQPIPMRIQVLQDARRAVEHIPNQDVLDIIDGLIQDAEQATGAKDTEKWQEGLDHGFDGGVHRRRSR